MTIMIIQRGCSDVTRAEDGKLHSHLEWPNLAIFSLNPNYQNTLVMISFLHSDLSQSSTCTQILDHSVIVISAELAV